MNLVPRWKHQQISALLPARTCREKIVHSGFAQEASPLVATGFLDDFEQTLALLKRHPEIGETGSSRTRRLVFQRYPYTVVYRLAGETLEIVAIAHYI